MSDQTPQDQGLNKNNINDAMGINWERNQSLLAKNQFAFSGPSQPVQFKFNTQPAATTPTTPQIQQPLPTVQSAPQPAPIQPTPVPTSISATTMPPALVSPTPPPAAALAPVPIGNFGKWAAYYNPNLTVNRPYFYCHTQQITTYDCPQEIQPEFAPQYAVFLQNYRAPKPPAQNGKPIPPPGFATLNRTNSALLMGSIPPPQNVPGHQTPQAQSQAIAGVPIIPITPSNASTSSPPLLGPPLVKPTSPLPTTPAGSSNHPIVQCNSLSVDPDGPALSVANFSQGTVADLTPHHAPQNQFSFNPSEKVSNPNPKNLPSLPPKLPPMPPPGGPKLQQSYSQHSSMGPAHHINNTSNQSFGTHQSRRSHQSSLNGAPQVEEMPDQHPLATIIAARPSQSIAPTTISLPPIKASLLSLPSDSHPPSFPPPFTPSSSLNSTPANLSNLVTPSHAASLGFPSHRPSNPFSPPQPSAQTVPNTTNINNDTSIPFSELLRVDALPTQKDGTFLKLTTGFRKSWKPRYIILHQGAFRWWDDLESAKKQMMQMPNAVVSVFGCVAQLPPIGSHVHPKNGLYVDGNVGGPEILDSTQDLEQASFFIRTDNLGEIDSWMHMLYRNGIVDGRYVLNPDLTRSNEAVVAQTHKCFEVWSRERVASATSGDVSFRELPPVDDLRTSFTADSLLSPRSSEKSNTLPQVLRPGMYLPGGLYQHQPTPVPVHVNGKKRPTPYFAVLFTDHIECYETYDEASLVCRYHNPDVNMTINAESLHDKPKIQHKIPLTPGTEISIERSSVSPSTYNEHSLVIKVKENKYRGIKSQQFSLAFEECNPVTGHSQVISTPTLQSQNVPSWEVAGSSLSVAQKWFSIMEYCIEGPLCGTFGTTLWWSVTRSTIPIPLVLHTCFRFISQKGLLEEGILRVPGNNQDIIRLRRTFDSCQTDAVLTDANTAAGLFKLFLRENQDGLVPRHMYKAFTSNNCRSAGAGASAEKRQPCVTALKSLVGQLPLLNQICLSYLIQMLTKISANASVNKMFPKNCAMVLSPNVFRSYKAPHPEGLFSNAKGENEYASPQQMAETLAEQEAIILIMIEHFAEIFPRGAPYP